MDTCKNCTNPVTGNYCSNCGQSAKMRRIDKHYIFKEIGDFFCANKGLLYTIKGMLLRPGKSVRQFVAEDRYRFVKPITFVIITSLIYTVINHFFQMGIKDYTIHLDTPESLTTNLIMEWIIIKYPGYFNIFMGFFIAFWIKLFFRKSNYNLFEIFILVCFVTGITSLGTSVIVILQKITSLDLIQPLNLLLIIYFIWATGQFFGEKIAKNYVKASLAYMVGLLVFGISVAIIGTIIDVFNGNLQIT
ncbi:MAG: DUF3667 domain-containing protein [Bacteroidales bacterium]|nr:DUF3667 domain-containing protein [Bacteroidales bacterium]